jgi:hypothetical protein
MVTVIPDSERIPMEFIFYPRLEQSCAGLFKGTGPFAVDGIAGSVVIRASRFSPDMDNPAPGSKTGLVDCRDRISRSLLSNWGCWQIRIQKVESRKSTEQRGGGWAGLLAAEFHFLLSTLCLFREPGSVTDRGSESRE